jgi:hypothetical protein
MKYSLFSWFLGPFLITACATQPAMSGSGEGEIVQWSGQQGGGSVPSTRVLRTVGEWAAFWRQLDREPPRALDAGREIAVVVHLGERRTGGFGVELLAARAEGGTFVVEYRETVPEPGAMVTQALTSPWVAGVVPGTDLPVEFRRVAAPGTRQER